MFAAAAFSSVLTALSSAFASRTCCVPLLNCADNRFSSSPRSRLPTPTADERSRPGDGCADCLTVYDDYGIAVNPIPVGQGALMNRRVPPRRRVMADSVAAGDGITQLDEIGRTLANVAREGPPMIRIAEFEPLASASGAVYRPRAYGGARDGLWDGYIVFFPVGPGTVISTPRETTQSNFKELQRWSLSLDRVYLEGALARALAATPGVAMPATVKELDLVTAETRAAGDAIALHRLAERAAAEATAELVAAEMHEQAAAAAHENAERLHRKHDELEELARRPLTPQRKPKPKRTKRPRGTRGAVAAHASPQTSKPKRARRKPSSSRAKRT